MLIKKQSSVLDHQQINSQQERNIMGSNESSALQAAGKEYQPEERNPCPFQHALAAQISNESINSRTRICTPNKEEQILCKTLIFLSTWTPHLL